MANSCIDGGYDDAPAEVLEEKIVKAKIHHTCGECFRTINPGESYEYVKGLWEGYWSTHKTCMPCVNMRDSLMCGNYCYGNVAETIAEALDMRRDEIV